MVSILHINIALLDKTAIHKSRAVFLTTLLKALVAGVTIQLTNYLYLIIVSPSLRGSIIVCNRGCDATKLLKACKDEATSFMRAGAPYSSYSGAYLLKSDS
jgi:hypothetical protein